MYTRLIQAVLLLGLAAGCTSQSSVKPVEAIDERTGVTLGALKKPIELVPGAQNAVVVGDPNKPGFYMVYTKWTKGNHFSRPHFHPNDRYIVVLQGTWWVGSGPKFDPEHGTVPMPAGSFVTHFGKQVHWDGAKDEDAVLLIMGEGPATSTLVAEEK